MPNSILTVLLFPLCDQPPFPSPDYWLIQRTAKRLSIFMEARSGQKHDNKIALQDNFNPTAANIMDMLCFFLITK